MHSRTKSIVVMSASAAALAVAGAAPIGAQTIAPAQTQAMEAGSTGRIAKFLNATAVGNSVMLESNGRIGLGMVPSPFLGGIGSLQIRTPAGGNGFMHTDGLRTIGTFVGTYKGVSGGIFGMQSNHPLQFTIQGGVKMTIAPTGDIGIGTPPLSLTRLWVKSDTSFQFRTILGTNDGGGTGVEGHSAGGDGIYGTGPYGVYGDGRSVGVYGNSFTGIGVFGISGNQGWAARFTGRVNVNGILSKLAGSFRIDHPQDPANKYLSHSFVESPDMKNIYDGNVILDSEGRATVELPPYFGALNRDFRYQLTAIGGAAPGLHIARKIADNRFVIAGGAPGVEVSWMVTGIRQDAYANAHRIAVEEEKAPHERGLFLAPQAHGQPDEKGIDWAMTQRGRAPRAPTALEPAKPHPQTAVAR